jgi:hypothetical protein
LISYTFTTTAPPQLFQNQGGGNKSENKNDNEKLTKSENEIESHKCANRDDNDKSLKLDEIKSDKEVLNEMESENESDNEIMPRSENEMESWKKQEISAKQEKVKR